MLKCKTGLSCKSFAHYISKNALVYWYDDCEIP